MNSRSNTCDRALLELLLADRLVEEERLTVEQHLSDCQQCRLHLEQLAAAPDLWTEVRESLSADELGGSGPSKLLSLSGDPDLPRVEQVLGILAPTDDPRMLGRFSGYEISGVIGCGGMGIVFKALDVPLNRYVAIKVLAPHLATSAAARLRFAREARAAAAVVHDNVVAIHAVSEAQGLPYLVMPYIRGTSLQRRLDTVGSLGAAEILRIGLQVAAGLAAAHAQGLVHRDIKPANILLEDGVERLKITDFGLARAADDASLTRSGVIAGTPQYMSPEQARGDLIDARSDLFSLGSVLYALCTGHPPFRAETSYGVLRRITDETPRPIRDQNPEIPDWLVRLIEKLHERNPGQRLESAAVAARLCEQCLAHLQQPHHVPVPESLMDRTVTPLRKVPRVVPWRPLIAGILMLGVVVTGLALWQRGAGQKRESASTGAPAEPLDDQAASADVPWDDGTDARILEIYEDVEDFAGALEFEHEK